MTTALKPEPGTTPVTTPSTPPLSPIQKAVADAKANLKAAQEATPPAEKPAASTGEQPPAPPANPDETKPGETKPDEGAKPGEEKPEETKPGETTPPADGEAAPETVVEIPGRRTGDKPIKLAMEDKETADLVRAALKDGLRREEFNRQMESVQRERDEIDMLEQHLDLDAVGFILERVKPELHVELARHLMSVPAVFTALREELGESEDENVRARRAAELRTQRGESQRAVDRKMDQLAASRTQARMVRNVVESIVPADMPDDEAALFRDDCIGDIAAAVRAHYAKHNSDPRLRPDDVVTMLDRRLRHFGITPESARAGLSSGQPPRRATAATPKGAPAPSIPDENAARTTGARLKQASDARREAAAVPGAGAGARPTQIELPANQGVKERIAFVRKLIGG